MQAIFSSERWHFDEPDAYWTIQYEYRRNGADMQYRFYWKAWVRWSTSWYDYGLQLRLFLDGVRHDVTVKGVTANNPGWSYEGTTEWYTIENKTTGTTEFYVSMYDTSRSTTQATSSKYSLIVSPCGAILLTAPDFTDNSNPTITYKNPAGNSVNSLQACISWTGGADITYRDIPKTGPSEELSYTFPFTEAERDLLRNATPTGVRNITFYVTTWIGSNVFYSTQPVELSIEETEATKPSVSMEVTLDSGSLPSEFDGLWIQGKSRADVKISAEGKYNASISSIVAQIGRAAYNSAEFKSNVIEGVGSVDIIATAKDSRKFTGEAKETITVIQYSKPLVIPIGGVNAVMCYRSDGNGNRIGNSTSLWIKAKRFYHSVNGLNQCALQWRRKLSTAAWDDNKHKWYDLISKDTANTDDYSALLPSTGKPSDTNFDLKTSYTVQIRAIDDIGEYDIKTFDIPTQDVALHLGEGGKNVAVGTYCDYSKPYTFYSDWDAYFDKNVYIGDKEVQLDYPIEQGSDSIWTYRKWESGIAECWGLYPITDAEVTTPWGSLFETPVAYSAEFPKGLFIVAPAVHFSVPSATGGVLGLETMYETTKDKTCDLYPIRATSDTIDLVIAIQAKGIWKENKEEETNGI